MVSRRSKAREKMWVESPGMQEAAAGEDGGVFFCVAATARGRKDRTSYFHSDADAGGEAARALAALCLDHAPELHRWHHHTVAGRRTFAFLSADDGRTYFAVADPTPGGAETVRFLERVRDAWDAAPRRRTRDAAVAPIVRQFAQTLGAAARTGTTTTSSLMAYAAFPGDSSPGEPSHAAVGDADGDKDEEDQRAVQPDEEGARRPTRRSWMRALQRHAMLVIGVDVALCLVLFVVWLIVCHGFRCVQR